jgi:hypothetical protein
MNKIIVLTALGAALFTSAAYATSADDKKWTAQCVADNKSEGAKDSVVLTYCKCMVDKMPEAETASVTQWEKTHVSERKACDKVAGWK